MKFRAGVYCRFGSAKQFEGCEDKIPQYIEFEYDMPDKDNNSGESITNNKE